MYSQTVGVRIAYLFTVLALFANPVHADFGLDYAPDPYTGHNHRMHNTHECQRPYVETVRKLHYNTNNNTKYDLDMSTADDDAGVYPELNINN
jgi:hypothetical protein